MKPLYIVCSLFVLILSACTSFQHEANTKRAACNLLKSRMIFNGSTSEVRKAQIENAEKPLDQATYDRNCE